MKRYIKPNYQVDYRPIIEETVSVLAKGGIILYPTDTIWGLGCDATNEIAVAKIFSIKQRDDAKSLVSLVANDRMLNRHVSYVPAIAWDLIDCTDTPLTIVYENVNGLANNVVASDGSGAIRLVKDAFCKRLIDVFKKPLVSTSANISGRKSPIHLDEISDEIKKQVNFIVPKEVTGALSGKVSSIIKISNKGVIEILRK